MLNYFRDLDEKIKKLANKMTIEFNKVFTDNYISDRVLYELYSVPNVKLKIPNTFDEMIKKVRKSYKCQIVRILEQYTSNHKIFCFVRIYILYNMRL